MPVTPFPLTRRIVAVLACSAALAACDVADNNAVRNGPQAVHPSPSKLAQGTPVASSAPATRAASDDGKALADQLFAQYCKGKSAAQSERALIASGNFGKPTITRFKNIGARFAIYPLKSRARASVAVVTGAIGGLQCSVGVDNAGPSLYEDGRVTYSG